MHATYRSKNNKKGRVIPKKPCNHTVYPVINNASSGRGRNVLMG